MAMLNLLDDLGHEDIIVHGFRSTFRDWVAECTDYPNSLAGQATPEFDLVRWQGGLIFLSSL